MANDQAVHLNSAGSTFTNPLRSEPEVDDVDLRQVLELLLAGRWTILLVAFAVFVLGLAYCLVATPTYRADGLVQVEQNSSKDGMLAQQQLGGISPLLLGAPLESVAEIQVLRSRMVLGQVADELNLQVSANPKYFPLIGAAIFRANNDAVAPVAVPSFLRRYAWGGERIKVSALEVPDKYLGQAFTLTKTEDGFLVRDKAGEVLKGKVGENAAAQTKDGSFAIFVQELRAATGTEFILRKMSRLAVLGQLSEKLNIIEQGKQSGVISISYDGPSPQQAVEIIDTLEDKYLQQNVERRSATAQQSLEYLEKQLPQLRNQVEDAQLKLKAYQSSHGSANVTQETELVLKQTVDLESQRLGLQQKREELLQRFTPEHPNVRALDETIRALDQARAKVGEEVQKLPTTQQEIFSLRRDLDVSNDLYKAMLDSIQQLRVAKAGTVGNVRVVDRALKPLKPVAPRVGTVLAVSAVVGLLLGVGLVFIQRFLLEGVDDPAEVEQRLGLVTYALVPFSSEQKLLLRKSFRLGDGQHSILAETRPQDPAIEALRSLRTSLHFALMEASNNVIMLTGPAPSLGKSFVSINLGAVLALSGKRAVVVDADLRRGHLHRYVAASASPGISDYVVGDADFSSICFVSPVKGLDVVFRGTLPPNPSELLLHERFAELIRKLSTRYDYVIVDTPPVLAVTDAAVVGRLAGSTLLVLKSACHSIREIEESVKRLLRGGVIVRGVLFNQVGLRPGSYGYGNYGYRYYNYESKT